MKKSWLVFFFLLLVFTVGLNLAERLAVFAQSETPVPTEVMPSETVVPLPTQTPVVMVVTSTPEFTPTPSTSPTETITPTPQPSETPVVIIIIVTATPTDTPTPSATPIEVPTAIPSETPSFTPTDTPIIIYVTATPTDTPTPTATFTITITPTETLTPTESLTPVETLTPTNFPSEIPTQTPTDVPVQEPSVTTIPIDTSTVTPTSPPIETPSFTPTDIPISTSPEEPPVTATETPILSETPTSQPTTSPTPPSNSAIGGTVFLDTNGDGIQGTGEFAESGQSGWVVKIYNEDWTRAITVITNQTGKYFVVGLRGGLYHVCEVLPNGWSQAAPAVGSQGVSVGLAPEIGQSNCYDILATGNRFPTYNANFANFELLSISTPVPSPTAEFTPTSNPSASLTPIAVVTIPPIVQQLVVSSTCSLTGNPVWNITNTNNFPITFHYHFLGGGNELSQSYEVTLPGVSQAVVYANASYTDLSLFTVLGSFTIGSQHQYDSSFLTCDEHVATPTPTTTITVSETPTETPQDESTPTLTPPPTPSLTQTPSGSSHISGQLFIDENQSGSFDTEEGEELLSDEATIFLYDSSWSQVATQTVIGEYAFQSLSGGIYYVCSSKLPGWNITTPVFEDANSILNLIPSNNSDFCHSAVVDGQVGSQNLNFGFF